MSLLKRIRFWWHSKRLNSSNPEARDASAIYLSKSNDPRAYKLLIDAIHQGLLYFNDTYVKIFLTLKEKHAINPIIQGINNENHQVRSAALEVAACKGNLWAIKPLILYFTREGIYRYTGFRNISDWSKYLNNIDEDWAKTQEAQSAVLDLISILSDPDFDQGQWGAALLVLNMINTNWTAFNEVSNNTIKHLTLLAACSFFKDIRDQALIILPKIAPSWSKSNASSDAIPFLAKNLQDTGYYENWCNIISILGLIDSEWKKKVKIEPIIYSLVNNLYESYCGHNAGIALSMIHNTWLYSPLGEQFTTSIYKDLAGSQDKKQKALEIMGNSRSPRFLQDLINILQQTEQESALIATAAESIGKIGDPSSLSYLIKLINETSSERVKAKAAIALGLIGGEEAREFLEKTLDFSLGKTKSKNAWDSTNSTSCYFVALGRIGNQASIRLMLLLYKEKGQIGITDFAIASFPRKILGNVLVEMGVISIKPILDFIEEVNREKLHLLDMDIFLEALTKLLKQVPSEISEIELKRIINLPELWEVASLGTSKGDLDWVDRIETRMLDSSKLENLAEKELILRKINKK